ncbi:MAG: hypothetical protein L6Q78_11060 [Bacteroidia bacterium]|nr:hypothetical protein [Bacteroidia bacterium]
MIESIFTAPNSELGAVISIQLIQQSKLLSVADPNHLNQIASGAISISGTWKIVEVVAETGSITTKPDTGKNGDFLSTEIKAVINTSELSKLSSMRRFKLVLLIKVGNGNSYLIGNKQNFCLLEHNRESGSKRSILNTVTISFKIAHTEEFPQVV